MPDHSDGLDLTQLAAAYRSGKTRLIDVISTVRERISRRGVEKVWIDRVPRAQLEARATEFENRFGENLPFYGIPFAIKDNIDLAGRPTTAACPDFSYTPEASATNSALPPERMTPDVARYKGTVRLAVCGAHMSGLPLNRELTERGARLLNSGRSAPHYRFYALEALSPPCPGMVRGERGAAIEREV